ncbi:GGDEF domain-containing protein [Desulfovibrio inopinatus]|uniref:GGDEF domain-containing protein n=1 Tax=Desulfovibrio inopinatus TaxID=102109 RepID=UPI0004111FBE|nr:GGDEF domain-containing protein [Desulfovibrio inopinatus]
MSAFSLGFHEEERVIARARACLEQARQAGGVKQEDFASLLEEYEKLFRQSMRLIKMGDRMQQKLSDLNETLERKQEELIHLAATDMLTGLINRRAFMDLANQALSIAKRHNKPLSLFLLDIDHFKRINDVYGHDIGDLALKHVACTGNNALRAEDVFARFGGEEFVALVPMTTPERALYVAERMRRSIENDHFVANEKKIYCTASIGISCFGQHALTVDQLLKSADEALYAAKSKGRNCVIIHPSCDMMNVYFSRYHKGPEASHAI